MKIYEIGTGYTPIPAQMGAATEIVVEELTKAFLKQEKQVQIIDIAADDRAETDLPILEVPVPKCFRGTDVQLGVMHKLKRVIYSVCLAGVLKNLLKKEAEKVVLHFHNQYNLFFFLKLTPQKLRRKAVIAYTNHSHVWHGEWDQISSTIQKRYFQEVYCMRHADYVFVLNNKTADHVLNRIGVDKGKIVLIDNGVNTEIYNSFCKEQKDQLRKKYFLQDKKVFIQVGSVCERKNQLETVQLLLPLLKTDKRNVFCYAGGIVSSEYQGRIQLFAEQNGVKEQVRYFGELVPGEELNEFYNIAEAMIFPSKAEGFSLVILEAMAAGLPVLISENLQFGLVKSCLRYANENEFQTILQNHILDESVRVVHSKESRHAVEAAYGWKKVADDYMKCFRVKDDE